jgi:hypothetical protein
MSKINLHNYEAFLIDYLDGNLKGAALAELKAFVLSNPQLEIDLNDLDLPSFSNETITIDFKNDLKKSETFLKDEEIINYLENNLTAADAKVVEAKLSTNKELELAFNAYKKTILSTDLTLVFEGKSNLSKTEDEFILNNAPLAYIEDQLGSFAKLKFEAELKTNSQLQKELSAYNKTKFIAESSIVFPNKEDLKKEAKVIALFSFRMIASLAAAILLIIGLAFVFNYYVSKPVITNQLANNKPNKTTNMAKDMSANIKDETDSITELVIKKSNLIAKSQTRPIKRNLAKNDSVIELNETKNTNSFAVKNIPDDTKTVVVNSFSASAVDTNNTKVAAVIAPESHYSKQNYIIAEEMEVSEPVASAPVKKGFWQRAVGIAKQANKLGIKSVDGEETSNQNYSLSFNSFSVEKR